MKLPFPSIWLRFKSNDDLWTTMALLDKTNPPPWSDLENAKSKGIALIALEMIRRDMPVKLVPEGYWI